MSFNPVGTALSSNDAWLKLVADVLRHGRVTAPRGQNTKELLGYQSVLDMRFPLMTLAGRKLGYKFTVAEAAWILSGDNRVATIAPYSRRIADFSDDGIFFFGAYGPKIRDQVSHVVDALHRDPDTRQAVINIWRESPRQTKDTPCTISVQFLLRDDTLHCMNTMRSSDCWLGIPYDWFNFSMLSHYVALLLRKRRGMLPKIGELRLTAGSQHIYEPQWEACEKILADEDLRRPVAAYAPLDPSEFSEGQDLIDHLWSLANKDEDADARIFAGARTFARELLAV